MTGRIDVHQHLVPEFYRDALRAAGIADAGGRAVPEWSPEPALALMDEIGTAAALLSVSAPGTCFLDDAAAPAMARRINTFGAELTRRFPRFGHFATLPMPDIAASVAEAEHALDELHADGVVLLANSRGTYLGAEGQEPLFAALHERSAVAFVHPAELPGPSAPGIPPFTTDFLLDTTRAAYLLVRNGILRRYPNIRFVLSHAGGFVPYAAHRMAIGMTGDTGRSPRDILTDLRSFWFDTALSGSPSALPSLIAFARPERVLFGSDWPFAPEVAVRYFTAGLDEHLAHTPSGAAISHDNAAALFPRLAQHPPIAVATDRTSRLRAAVKDRIVRGAVRLVDPTPRHDY